MSKYKPAKILFVCFLLSIVWCRGVPAYALSMTDVHKEYIQGNSEKAIRLAKNLRESGETLYFLGLAHIKIGEYPKARVFLRKLIRRFPDSRFCNPGMIKNADTYFLDKEYIKAKELYLAVKEEFPSSDNMPLVLLRLAQIASREGNWGEKRKYLEYIKSRYPKASEMKFVKVLETLGDFFTIQVGAFTVETNALTLVEELKSEYSPYIVEDKKGNYPIYKVRVGKYERRSEAKRVSAKLFSSGYPARIYP